MKSRQSKPRRATKPRSPETEARALTVSSWKPSLDDQYRAQAIQQEIKEQGFRDWSGPSLINRKQTSKKRLPKDQRVRDALLVPLDRFVGWLSRLIETVHLRANKLHSCPNDLSIVDEMELKIKSLLASPETHLMEEFAPFVGWGRDNHQDLSRLLIAYKATPIGGTVLDLCNELYWTYLVEDDFLHPAAGLRDALRVSGKQPCGGALPQPPSPIEVILNGDKSEIHCPFGPFPVNYDAALFIKEIVEADGRPVSCSSINNKYSKKELNLRTKRIREKIPERLRDFFVTVQAGTYFDKQRMAAEVQKTGG